MTQRPQIRRAAWIVVGGIIAGLVLVTAAVLAAPAEHTKARCTAAAPCVPGQQP
jgi:uncharacterized protein involved in exopolysaccharide biosynthesis